jgi:hypothetical protein
LFVWRTRHLRALSAVSTYEGIDDIEIYSVLQLIAHGMV